MVHRFAAHARPSLPAPEPVRSAVSRRSLLAFSGLSPILFAGRGALAAENGGRPLAVYGDSQAQGLAASLRSELRGGAFRLLNRTKPGTALGQPVAHDWVAAVRQSIEADRPAVAVMMFGGNDRVPARLADGRNLAFRGEPWLAFYRERLAAMVSALSEAGVLIVWCGNPNTRHQGYANDMAYLNDLYRAALPASGAVFVDIWNVAADRAGGYQSHGPGTDGSVQRLRTDDGIHFTRAGYDLVAQRVVRAVEALTTTPAPGPAPSTAIPRSPPAAAPEAASPATPPDAESPDAGAPATAIPDPTREG